MSHYTTSPIIQHLRAVDRSAAVEIEKMIVELEPLIDRIDSTFPTYTLHNHVHSENVLGLMESLLGEGIGALSTLEASVLILSAYAHDVGMLATPAQLERIKTSRDFKNFLASNDKAFLRWGIDEATDLEVLQDYCRSTHPQRASVWIREIRPDPLVIDGVDVRELLEQVCLAHGVDETEVRQLDNNFRGNCDLIFCSIMLRLADILDFDDSRAPVVLMKAVGLNTPTTKSAQFSSGEWRKHGVSKGFSFPVANGRGQRYPINFSAVPTNPNIHADISYYLDLVDREMRTAESLARHCSDRWRNHSLPGSMSRSIQPSNYEYGDYRVSIDAGAVLDLFTGTNLYTNEHVFLRELIQNALDAHRARRALDRGFERAAITVRTWREGDDTWMRIDDQGIGMSAEVLRTYMLRVGASYYESESFQALLRRRQDGDPLKTIGRFGVGLLSVFMVADRVEITTLRDGNDYAPVRASFGSLDSYFVVQTGKNVPDRFPSPRSASGDDGYRKDDDFGTSVALRFKPGFTYSEEEVLLLLSAAVLDAPDDVVFNGTRIAEPSPDSFYEKPSGDGRVELKGLEKFANLVEARGGTKTADALRACMLTIEPLDFSKGSGQLTGSGAVSYVDWQMAYEAFLSEREALSSPSGEGFDDTDRFQMHYDGVEESIVVRVRLADWETLLDDEGPDEDRSWWSNVQVGNSRIVEDSMTYMVSIPVESVIPMNVPEWWRESELYAGPSYLRSYWVGAEWSHNGIRLPLGSDHWASVKNGSSGLEVASVGPAIDPVVGALIFGAMALTDELRVDVNVSRDRIQRIPFSVQSAIRLAVLRALRDTRSLSMQTLGSRVDRFDWERLSNSWGADFDTDDAMNPLVSKWRDDADDFFYLSPRAAAVRADHLANESAGWLSEHILIKASGERVSINEALRHNVDHDRVEFMPISFSGLSWEGALAWVLTVDRFDLLVRESGALILRPKDAPGRPFFEKESFTLARLWDPTVLVATFSWDVSYINTAHPFMGWLKKAGERMTPSSRRALTRSAWTGEDGENVSLAPLKELLSKIEWLPDAEVMAYSGPLEDESIFVLIDD